MSKKVYEISFAIAGKMGNSFGGAFAFASSRIQKLQTDVKKLNDQYRKGEMPLEEYTQKQQRLARQIHETKRAQEMLNKGLERQHQFLRTMGRTVRNTAMFGVGVAGAGVAAGGYFGYSSLQKAMQYEAQLSSIQATANLTNEELSKMNSLALKMGAKTKFSALEAAQGIEELLKAGISPAIVQAGGLEAALNLATAGGLDLAEAATIMSDALHGFGKDGMSAANASDILAGAAVASSTNVREMAEAISQVGPVADGIGVSFRGVNATLAAFSNNMLKGSDAGTSLKTFLANVQPQTKDAMSLFRKYGLMTGKNTNLFFQANGQLKDMADIAGMLQMKFAKLNDQQRSDVFYNLFGSDAVRAATILYKQGSKGIQDMYKSMSKVSALDVAKKKMDNAAGAVEQFRGALETLQISALMPTMPLIKELALGAADFAEKYTPAITDAMKHAVDSAQAYMKHHFKDNPEFQNLSTEAKIKFVFDDLGGAFAGWYDAQGREILSNATEQMVAFMAEGVANSAETVAKIGVDIGAGIARGLLRGFGDALTGNRYGAFLSGAIAGGTAGSVIPGVGTAVGAAGGGAVGVGAYALHASSPYVKNQQEIAKYNDFLSRLEQHSKENPGQPYIQGGHISEYTPDEKSAVQKFKSNPFWLGSFKRWVRGYATGGIATSPHLGLVAEAGWPEAMIPLNGSTRSKSLWLQAGERLGMGGYGGGGGVVVNATYAPVIHGSNRDEIEPILREHQKNFVEQLEETLRQRRRVSFD